MSFECKSHAAAFAFALAVFGAAPVPASAQLTTLTVTNSRTIKSPTQIGYNYGNDSEEMRAWLELSGTNTIRYRTHAYLPRPADQAINLSQFIELRERIAADLRNRPQDFDSGAAQSLVDWGQVREAWSVDDSLLDFLDDLDRRSPAGMSTVAFLDSSSADASGQGLFLSRASTALFWSRWVVWRMAFAYAYFVAREHNVTQFEFFNEPDLDSDMTPELALEYATLFSDAIQRAFQTLNQWRAAQNPPLPAMTPVVVAAAAASENSAVSQFVANNRVITNFFGMNPSAAGAFPFFNKAFSIFSFHLYDTYDSPGAAVTWRMNAAVPLAGSGTPIYLTETNLRRGQCVTERNWNSDTLDSTRSAVKVAQLLEAEDRLGATGIFPFTFGEHPHGLQWQAHPDVVGSKRAGEVVRLFAEGFADSMDRYAATLSPSDSKFKFIVGRSSNPDRYSILSINDHCNVVTPGPNDHVETRECGPGGNDDAPTSCAAGENWYQSFILDLSAWGIQPGTKVTVKEVGLLRRGEPLKFFTVDANRRISYAQWAQSVVLIEIPTSGPRSVQTVTASEDAYVRGAQFRTTNYANGNLYAYARQSGADNGNRRFTVLKFYLSDLGIAPQDIGRALLRVTGDGGAEGAISGRPVVNVYGIDDDSWTEGTVRWSSLPNLRKDNGNGTTTDQAYAGDIISFHDNLLQGVGITAHPLGVISANGMNDPDKRVDVTRFMRAQTNGVASFMLVREVRSDTDLNPADESFWCANRLHPTVNWRPTLEIVTR